MQTLSPKKKVDIIYTFFFFFGGDIIYTCEKAIMKSSSGHPQFNHGLYLTLKKVIDLTEAHQDKFWTKLLPFLSQLQVGLEILNNLASMFQQEHYIISV